MQHNLKTYWHELEERYAQDDGVYRRLDLEQETGIRMAVLSPGQTWAILIEILPEDASTLMPPSWRGMGCKIIPLVGPEPDAKHICLYVENPEHRSVFTTLSSDIIKTLESSDRTTRVKNLQNCFNRWSRFFEIGVQRAYPRIDSVVYSVNLWSLRYCSEQDCRSWMERLRGKVAQERLKILSIWAQPLK